MEEAKFNLTVSQNKETNLFEIANYAAVKEACEAFCGERSLGEGEAIQDDFKYKEVKEWRTEIRKRKDLIGDCRKAAVNQILGAYVSGCKELEEILDAKDQELKKLVDAYAAENKGKVARPHVITLTVKSYDMAKLEKVKAYAEKLGLAAGIKE